MKTLDDKQLEELSQNFQSQMRGLSDIAFIKSPWGNVELSSLQRQIASIEKDKDIKDKETEIQNLIKNFRTQDGKNFQELRKEVSGQASEIMSVENLKSMNSLISEAIKRMGKNPYWQSLTHPSQYFNAQDVELTLPEKRGGRCFRAQLDDNNYKDVVTLNPLGFTQWLNNKNIHSHEDKLACIEAHIIHELTHGDQYNRIVARNGISADFPPTDTMPSLIETPTAKKTQNTSTDDNTLLMDALWEADTRSTAYRAILEETDISESSKEKIMQMQLQFNGMGVKQEAPKGRSQKELFFVTLKNYLNGIKKLMPQVKLEFSKNTLEYISHIYDAQKYGKFEDFVHEIKKTVNEINQPQKENQNIVQEKLKKLRKQLHITIKPETKPFSPIAQKYMDFQQQKR